MRSFFSAGYFFCLFQGKLKKIPWCFILFYSVFLASCAVSVDEHTENAETLKRAAQEFESEALWSGAAEESSSDSTEKKSNSEPAEFSPASAALACLSDVPVFPSLKNSFSLDVSEMDRSALETLNSFFSAFESGGDFEIFFEKESLYSLGIFLHDLSVIQASALNHIAGKPFFSDGIYQCPVRIFLGKNTGGFDSIDVYACMNKQSQKWTVFQLQIFSWNKKEDSSFGGEDD
ncbi:hypothetical protein [Treponema sp.]|uniref:hypothetical protein n=1 Tax=Treponema sp. TaxID=166 RepID=UPI003F101942